MGNKVTNFFRGRTRSKIRVHLHQISNNMLFRWNDIKTLRTWATGKEKDLVNMEKKKKDN